MSNADWQQLSPEHARLQSFYIDARGFYANADVADEAAAGINNMFAIASANIRKLSADGELGRGVIQGTVTPARWVAVANQVGNTIKTAMQSISESDLYTRAWVEVVVPTAREAKEVAAKALDTGTNLLTLVVIGLALIVVLRVVR